MSELDYEMVEYYLAAKENGLINEINISDDSTYRIDFIRLVNLCHRKQVVPKDAVRFIRNTLSLYLDNKHFTSDHYDAFRDLFGWDAHNCLVKLFSIKNIITPDKKQSHANAGDVLELEILKASDVLHMYIGILHREVPTPVGTFYSV